MKRAALKAERFFLRHLLNLAQSIVLWSKRRHRDVRVQLGDLPDVGKKIDLEMQTLLHELDIPCADSTCRNCQTQQYLN